MSLSEAAAFSALSKRLRGEAVSEVLSDPPFERLRLALDDQTGTSLDRAVLIRHALRYESLRRNVAVSVETDLIGDSEIATTHLNAESNAKTNRISALPWCPDWLPRGTVTAVDDTAMRAPRRRFFAGDEVPADPFLRDLGYGHYRSRGQRIAVRAALAMPVGAMLIIDLPTGEGKSLVFRAIDRIGFVVDPPRQGRGTTLVIVPTVTLAIDHERNCGGDEAHPLAYIGGRTERNNRIREAIKSGQQGLCFAAPEAAVGPLRHALAEAARQGSLRAVIIDEAHLIEGWGTGFRTEFQTFAGVSAQWRTSSPNSAGFRTIMLSATLTEPARQTLLDLFAPDGDLPIISAARVRPEPEYWVVEPTTPEIRDARVEEALNSLPRPAILYVTEVAEAERWFKRLRDIGFGRLEVVHGQTSSQDRQRVLARWAQGSLDLVVATSAFGLGVDYPHVRTIIHACLPESFDRFYQEVGRSGRDGCASISLLLPTHHDLEVARSLSVRTVISVERGLQRWKAMISDSQVKNLGNSEFAVRLNAAPSYDPEDIDLVGERSIDWNARTLALMARSGFIHLRGVPDNFPTSDGVVPAPYQIVRVVEGGHLEQAVWEKKVAPKRAEIYSAAHYSLQLMHEFLSGDACPSRLIDELYRGLNRRVAAACSGCGLCRLDKHYRLPSGIVVEQPIPWPIEGHIMPALDELWQSPRRLLVEYPVQNNEDRSFSDFKEVVRRLDLYGLRLMVFIGDVQSALIAPAEAAVRHRPWVLLCEDKWAPPNWPKGAKLVVFGPDAPVSQQNFVASPEGDPCIIFVPDGQFDGLSRDRRLINVVGCPTMKLSRFVNRLLK
jgi:ATP-dependent DNA helicase RecQ